MQPNLLTAALLGVLLGTAGQLGQAALWSDGIYTTVMLLALVTIALVAIKIEVSWWRGWVLVLACAAMAFGATGWRSQRFLAQSLAPALEGRDIAVTGMVAAMPQRNETGLRFRFDVDSAQWQGQQVQLPKRLELAWYSGVFARGDGPGEMVGELQRVPQPLHAGQRWQFTVRLKAPHGAVNPHGFDYELWQWEQGVQATGYVRAGPKDPAPLALANTWQRPVEWARGALREQIFAHVAEPSAAGQIAALVVGDQAAIDGFG